VVQWRYAAPDHRVRGCLTALPGPTTRGDTLLCGGHALRVGHKRLVGLCGEGMRRSRHAVPLGAVRELVARSLPHPFGVGCRHVSDVRQLSWLRLVEVHVDWVLRGLRSRRARAHR